MHGRRRGTCTIQNRIAKALRAAEEMWKNLATLPSATDNVPSNGWADAVVRDARAAVAPFIDPVAEAGHRRLRNRPGPILDTHHVTLVCVDCLLCLLALLASFAVSGPRAGFIVFEVFDVCVSFVYKLKNEEG